jgi:hypothetical protein
VIYVACVLLWFIDYLLPAIFPNFTLLTVGSFIYGLITSGLYGWFVAITFVFFYNLWPSLAAALSGRRAEVSVNADSGNIVAEVVTVDNSLVQRMKVDRSTGNIEYEN